MKNVEEHVESITKSFTGNGDYYFEYVKPEDCLSLVSIYNGGIEFIKTLIEKEETLRTKLSENLDLYTEKNLTVDYDKTFSQWSKCNLVIWDLKDILCRMGIEVD